MRLNLSRPFAATDRRGIFFSCFGDGRLAEVFLAANKSGDPMQAIARDAAVTASLQYGCPLQAIRSATAPPAGIGAAVNILREFRADEGRSRAWPAWWL
jgi:hypothetical protein